MDAAHKNRLNELEAKGQLDKNEEKELAGLLKHQAATEPQTAAPVVGKSVTVTHEGESKVEDEENVETVTVRTK